MAIVLKTDDQIENIKLEQNKDILKAYKNALYDDVLSNLSEQVSHITASSWQSIRELNKKIEQAINNFKPEQASYLEMLEQYRLKGTQVLDDTDESLYITISKDKKIIVYIVSTIHLNLAKQALNNNDFGISLHFHKKHIELSTIYNHSNGYSVAEIREIALRDPNRIANNPQKKENERQGIEIANHILSQDTDQLLTTNDVRELVLDALKHKYQSNKAILKTLPKESKALRYWFKGDNKLPAYLSKGGRPKDDNRAKQQLIKDIRASIIK